MSPNTQCTANENKFFSISRLSGFGCFFLVFQDWRSKPTATKRHRCFSFISFTWEGHLGVFSICVRTTHAPRSIATWNVDQVLPAWTVPAKRKKQWNSANCEWRRQPRCNLNNTVPEGKHHFARSKTKRQRETKNNNDNNKHTPHRCSVVAAFFRLGSI